MLWVSVFFAFLSSFAQAQDPHAGHNHGAPEPFLYCPETEKQAQTYKLNFNAKLAGKISCNPFDVNNLCQQARGQCKSVTGQEACFWALPDKQSCPAAYVISEEDLKAKRTNNFYYMNVTFNELVKKKSDLKNRCCGTNEFCKIQFPNISLSVKEGLGRNELVGRAQLALAVVEVSNAQIGSCQNAECLDGIIYHEVAHLCHQMQQQTTNSYVAPGFQNPTKVKQELANLKGENGAPLVGEDGANCVMKALEDALRVAKPEIRNNPNTLTAWMEEAYADAIYADMWSPGKVAYNCTSMEDVDHAAGKTYLGCFKHSQKFTEKFCATGLSIGAGPSKVAPATGRGGGSNTPKTGGR